MRIKHIMDGTPPAFKRLRDKLMLGGIAGAITLVGSIALVGSLAVPAPAMADPAQEASAETPQAVQAVVVSPMVTGTLTSKFGPALDPFKKGKTRNHFGIDIKAPMGTPIFAPADGIIRDAAAVYDGKPAYGNVVVLETEGGIMTMFAHLEGYTVTAGQIVTKGEQIATVGSSGKSTGPHVHIETHKDGKRVDPETIWDFSSD